MLPLQANGAHYARIRIQGKLIRRSLKSDVISAAALRLSDFRKEERAKENASGKVERGKVLFGDAANMLADGIAADQSLKPRTKAYYRERIIKLYKSWP